MEVDDSTYSTNNWTNIDVGTSFSANCSIFSNINKVNKEINLNVHPNPFTKNITLDFGKVYQKLELQVIDLTGQIVLTKTIKNSSTATIELEGATGIFLVQVHTEEGTIMLKLIKK